MNQRLKCKSQNRGDTSCLGLPSAFLDMTSKTQAIKGGTNKSKQNVRNTSHM